TSDKHLCWPHGHSRKCSGYREGPSVCHRVYDVIDAEVKCRRCVPHGLLSFVEPLPILTNVIVVIHDHLQISMIVAETEELYCMLTWKDVGGGHVKRFDLIKRVKDRIG